MKLRVTPLSGLYSRIFNMSLISLAPKEVGRLCGSVRSAESRQDRDITPSDRHRILGRAKRPPNDSQLMQRAERRPKLLLRCDMDATGSSGSVCTMGTCARPPYGASPWS